MSEKLLTKEEAKREWSKGENIEVNENGLWREIGGSDNLSIFNGDGVTYRLGQQYVNINGRTCIAPTSQGLDGNKVTLTFKDYQDAHVLYNSLMPNKPSPF